MKVKFQFKLRVCRNFIRFPRKMTLTGGEILKFFFDFEKGGKIKGKEEKTLAKIRECSNFF